MILTNIISQSTAYYVLLCDNWMRSTWVFPHHERESKVAGSK